MPLFKLSILISLNIWKSGKNLFSKMFQKSLNRNSRLIVRPTNNRRTIHHPYIITMSRFNLANL